MAPESDNYPACRLAVGVPRDERVGAEFIGMSAFDDSCSEPVEYLLADSSVCDLDDYRNPRQSEAPQAAEPWAPAKDPEEAADDLSQLPADPAPSTTDRLDPIPSAPVLEEVDEQVPNRCGTGHPATQTPPPYHRWNRRPSAVLVSHPIVRKSARRTSSRPPRLRQRRAP